MTVPTISRTVLDHVHAYAQQVRTHLADLTPDQVEDLTDGLEADLAEALADSTGPVATGEIPVVGPAGVDATATAVDLTARFGPAATYAAELRASAGLGEARGGTRSVRLPLRARRAGARTRGAVERLATGARESIRPVVGTPAARSVAQLAELLRPLWWVVRGWLWYVLAHRALDLISWGGAPAEFSLLQFVPADAGTWVVAVAAMLASLVVGRRRFARGTWQRRTALALSGGALVAMPWAVSTVWGQVDNDPGVEVRYVPQEVVVEVPGEVQDGVYVDGILVSNLFVYDAEGNPLDRVQIVDDRGRPVRTTTDEGTQSWFMPGVDEPWQFGADLTADGRERWNVYPLRGLPMSEVDGEVAPAAGDLRLPPLPFAQAPTLAADPFDAPVGEPEPGAGAEQGSEGTEGS